MLNAKMQIHILYDNQSTNLTYQKTQLDKDDSYSQFESANNFS